ncbi:PD-(D/E)XK nuclease family protein [Alkalihalobacillus sp. MEB130]|uniref:PD-(D/E)XK nuclease family protein n=1 Tax=Alkalihalobacillus sp. MEB130 TaxID=2976704 RepID=UPI0028DEDC44|nr:PD-(D/E)XK nuclease family protein [Alkalihalobacillus sp. MEB130]MDT8859563.1 PD-(D/E)XK nuclease family protein [Alkalihalobacillus sp. MEB130]
MSEYVVYGTHVKEVANKDRLEKAFQLAKSQKEPVFYVLPSQMWLQEARSKRPGLLATTFDDIATFILDQGQYSYIALSEEERTLFFLQFIKEETAFHVDEVVSGKARAYADTYGQIKRLGLDIKDIPESLLPLQELFFQYEQRISKEKKLLDPENIILHAIGLLKQGGNGLDLSAIYIDGYYDFSPLQMLFIESLKDAGVSIDIYVPNHTNFTIVEKTMSELISIGFTDGREKIEEEKTVEQVSVVAASTNEEQWRGIVEEILLSNRAFDQTGILLVDERNGIQELMKYASMYQIPINKAKKRKLSTTSIYSFLLTGLSNTLVPKSKWEQLPLVEQILKLFQVSGLEFAKQKQMFLQTGEWMHDEHSQLFERINRLEWKKQEPFIVYIKQLRNVITSLPFFTFWEEQFTQEDEPRNLREMATEYKALQQIDSQLENYESLLKEKGLEDLLMTLDLFVEWIKDLGESLQLFEERASKSGISIHTWRDVSLFQGEKLYVVGMNEGAFPAPHHLSGYVQERDLHDSSVRFSTPDQEHFRLKQLAYFEQLSYVSKAISFTYVKGIDAHHPLLPSTLLEGLQVEDKIWSWENRMKHDYSHSQEDQLEKLAYHLGRGYDVGELPEEIHQLKERVERLEEGAEPISLTHDQPLKPVVSVTALESYARCPFRFGMERVLQVPEPAALQEAVSPIDIGDFIHDIIEEVFNELKAVGQSFSMLKNAISHIPDRVDELFEEKWAEIERRSTEISRFDLQLTKQQWQKRLQRWWQAERKHFFDNDHLDQMFIMAIEKSIRFELPLPNGKTLVLTGKADRIDRMNDSIVVYDYKSGQASVKMEDVRSGLKLQLPLYAFAIREELERLEEAEIKADGATYISLKEPGKRAGNGMWRTEHVGKSSKYNVSTFCRNREDYLGTEQFLVDHELKERIAEIWHGMQTNFPVEPIECSPFCSYRTVCRVTDEKREQAKR